MVVGGLFGGVYSEGDGPEAVVVGALGVAEQDLPGLRGLISSDTYERNS